MKKVMLMEFKNTKQEVVNGKLVLHCNRKGCCGGQLVTGNHVPRSLIIETGDQYMISEFLECSKSVLYVENMENSLSKISEIVDKLYSGSKRERVLKSIKGIEAYSCKIPDIMVISRFKHLEDLNLSSNPDIVSLKGIEQCQRLKTLNCRSCNLTEVSELEGLKFLEYVDLGENENLESLDGLEDNPSLVELSIRK